MKRETIKTTTDRRYYKMLKRKAFYDDRGLCHYCGPHSGCNSNNHLYGMKNWKKFRKTQYKCRYSSID